MDQTTAKIDQRGRVVIPAKFRKQLGWRRGDEVILRMEDGRLALFTREQALKRLQKYVCDLVPPEVSLSEELIRDRRLEAARG